MSVGGVTYAEGDAFSFESLAALQPRPNVAIVSGLYELFPGNAPLLESLRGLAAAVDFSAAGVSSTSEPNALQPGHLPNQRPAE